MQGKVSLNYGRRRGVEEKFAARGSGPAFFRTSFMSHGNLARAKDDEVFEFMLCD